MGGPSFRIGTADLQYATRWALQSLSAKPSPVILGGMLLEVTEEGELVVSAYNGLTSTTARVRPEEAVSGRMLLPGHLLQKVLDSLDDKTTLEMEADGDKIALYSAGAGFRLPPLEVDDYPSLPVLPQACGWVDGDDFRRAVKAVAPATETAVEVNDVRLDAVNLAIKGKQITFVSTDTSRMPVVTCGWHPEGEVVDVELMIPPKPLQVFSKAAQGRVALMVPPVDAQGGMVGLACGGLTLSTGRYMGKFPAWQRALPQNEADLKVTVDVAELQGALKRAQAVVEDLRPIQLSFVDGCLQIESSGEASMAEVIAAEIPGGGELTHSYNVGFLLEALAAAPTPKVVLHVRAGRKATVITAAADKVDYRYLIMPQRQV